MRGGFEGFLKVLEGFGGFLRFLEGFGRFLGGGSDSFLGDFEGFKWGF